MKVALLSFLDNHITYFVKDEKGVKLEKIEGEEKLDIFKFNEKRKENLLKDLKDKKRIYLYSDEKFIKEFDSGYKNTESDVEISVEEFSNIMKKIFSKVEKKIKITNKKNENIIKVTKDGNVVYGVEDYEMEIYTNLGSCEVFSLKNKKVKTKKSFEIKQEEDRGFVELKNKIQNIILELER